jgi:hypothetical protein
MDRWQLDASAWLIQLLEKAHLASNVCRIPLATRMPSRGEDLNLVPKPAGSWSRRL